MVKVAARYAVSLSIVLAGCGADAPGADAGFDGGADAGLDGGAGPLPDAGAVCSEPWPDLQWGTALDDEVSALAVDDAGRLFVAGFERGRVDGSRLEPMGDAVGVVSWWDPSGAPLGAARADTPSADVIEDVLPTGSGQALVLGRTLGTFAGQTAGGQYDAFLATLTLGDGELRGLVQIGGRHPEHPRRLVRSGDRWAAVGYTDVYVPTNFVEDFEDPLVITGRWAAGALEDAEAARWPSVETDFAQAGQLLDDGSDDLVVAHHSTAGPDRGAWLRRRRTDGTDAWATRLTTTGFDSAMVVLPAGDSESVWLFGSTFAALGDRAYGQLDAYAARERLSDGVVLEALQAGTSESDWVLGAARASDGTLYVVGETGGSFTGGGVAEGEAQAFAIRWAADGQWSGSWQRDTPGLDVARAVVVDACGRVLVGGYSTGPIAGGALGGRDAFVVQASFEPRP